MKMNTIEIKQWPTRKKAIQVRVDINFKKLVEELVPDPTKKFPEKTRKAEILIRSMIYDKKPRGVKYAQNH